MTAKELKDHILQYMTADEVLEKLLVNVVIQYDEICKVGSYTPKEKGESFNPLFIIVAAATDMGWGIAVSKEPTVNGLVVGTEEYLRKMFPKGD